MAYLRLDNVSVAFPVFSARGRALKSSLSRRSAGGQLSTSRSADVITIHAINGLSLSFNEGDRVALIGRNGAGKTTMLRVLAGLYPATGGVVSISGSVAALTDIGMGLDPELTGRENTLTRLVILGLSEERAQSLVPEIADFAELGEFFELPIRTYSSGMLLRLAFAVSTAIQPDILILDEVISAGDAGFIDKARHRIETLIQTAKILVLASHDPGVLRQFCNRGVWMHRGELVFHGAIEDALAHYQNAVSAGSI